LPECLKQKLLLAIAERASSRVTVLEGSYQSCFNIRVSHRIERLISYYDKPFKDRSQTISQSFQDKLRT